MLGRVVYSSGDCRYYTTSCDLTSDKPVWGDFIERKKEPASMTGFYVVNEGNGLIWTNHDILRTLDDTLYLAASDPIPVQSYDPTALLQGYLVGCRLRAMRGKKPTEPDTPVEPEYDVVFENGVLYIKKAPAVMVGTTLSLAALDIKGVD
jgi:hypothetical protein